VICDEAHRMKNISTLLGKSLRQLRSKCRLLLTGTPVQNALQDLWALMDFASPGLLGNHATFVKTFSEPIDRGSVRGAKVWAVELKKHLSEQLRALISPHILRRTKMGTGLIKDVDADEENIQDGEAEDGEGAIMKQLPPKKETIVWLLPSEDQLQLYRKILENSDIIKEATEKQKLGVEVFRAIGLLKRLCNHPALIVPCPKPGAWAEHLSEAVASSEGKAAAEHSDAESAAVRSSNEDDGAEAPLVSAEGSESLAVEGAGAVQDDARSGKAVEIMLRNLPRDNEALLQQSAKLKCLNSLLPKLAAKGRRTLIFSQSVKMLDLIQICVLKPNNLRCLRIDGATDCMARNEKVAKFNREIDRFQCMLLTTHVGGVGLNLTSADRVILVDPAWNPATDAQAVDRAFRIGQTKEVRVYRLVMSGFIEDKMFRLQVFKMGLTKTALEADQKHNYFTKDEIKALFEWSDPAEGVTRKLLQDKHGENVDEDVIRCAEEDGSKEGWFAAGPAVGLSDFGSLYGAVCQGDDDEEEDDASAALVAEAKEKLGAADENLHRASEARQQAQAQGEQTSRDLEDGMAACELVKEKKAAAEEFVKEKRASLRSASSAETAAQQRLDRAMRGKASAEDGRIGAKQKATGASEATAVAENAVSEAVAQAMGAEEAFFKALADVEAQLGIVGPSGKGVGTSAVDAKADTVRKAQRALEKAKTALESLGMRQAELDVAEDDVHKTDRGIAEAEYGVAKVGVGDGDDNTAAGSADAQLAIARKGAEITKKNREKERARAEQAQGKAALKVDVAREAVAAALQTLTEAGHALAESFTKTQARAVRADQVKAAQQATKAAFRPFNMSFVNCKKAREAVSKAINLRRKAVQKASLAGISEAEATLYLAHADREVQEATADEDRRRSEREDADAALGCAEADRTAVEVEEIETKRRRDELKAAGPVAKEGVKAARLAEKEAALARSALHAACSKVEREKSQLEDAMSNAVTRLKAEEYDPNQVEQAYEKAQKAGD